MLKVNFSGVSIAEFEQVNISQIRISNQLTGCQMMSILIFNA